MLALDAAIEGQGVALAPLPLAERELAPRRARDRRLAQLRAGHRDLSLLAAQGPAHALPGGHRVSRLGHRGSARDASARPGRQARALPHPSQGAVVRPTLVAARREGGARALRVRYHHGLQGGSHPYERPRLSAPSGAARRHARLRVRRRPVERRRRRRHRAPPDRRPGRARHALLLAGRQMARVREPRRAASRGLPHAGRGRQRAPDDVARAGRDGARLHARRSHPVRHHARPAVLPKLSRVHARSRGRHAEAPAARAGQSSRVWSRQGDRDRAQYRRSRALEALSRWHRRAPLDRRDRRGRVPAHERACGQHHEPDVDRRSRVLPVRCRRCGQSVLGEAGRLGANAAYRSRRLLRAPRADRRQAHRLPVRRADLRLRSGVGHDTAGADPRAGASHAGGAQVRVGGGKPRRLRAASCRP